MHVAACPGGKREPRRRFVVRRFGDHHGIVLPHDEVERLELSAHLPHRLLGGLEPHWTVFDLLDALLSVLEQRDVRWHCPYSSPETVLAFSTRGSADETVVQPAPEKPERPCADEKTA